MLIKIRFTSYFPRFLVVVAAMLGVVGAAESQSRLDEDFDDENKPWQEITIQFPTAPQTANLLPFYVSATATQSFAIDAKSLTVGSDGVIRYTLVIDSPGGAKNITYEGIRCGSFEKKIYAIGQPDGSWSRSRRNQWERIVQNAANRQHATLAKDYFCQNLVVAGDAKQMIERIRWQQPLTQQLGE